MEGTGWVDFTQEIPEGWNELEESLFRTWFEGQAKRLGLDPNPDDPRHEYNYRAAFRMRVEPEIDEGTGELHWNSAFKSLSHPNRYVDGMDTISGRER